MNMEIVIIFVVGTLSFLGIAAYFLLMIYYPEWVGITGKTAKKNLAEHEEGSASSDPQIFEDLKK